MEVVPISHTLCLHVMQKLLIRHLLDAMHIEKNLCENMVKTTLGRKILMGASRICKGMEFVKTYGWGHHEIERKYFICHVLRTYSQHRRR
jgi:hypothetical protein